MPLPYTFAGQAGNIPLSYLDTNFSYLLGLFPSTGFAAAGANNDITSLGALSTVPTVVTNSVVNLIGNQSINGIKTFVSTPVLPTFPSVTAQSQVTVYGFGGTGSTNPGVATFAVLSINTGSDITFLGSGVNGDTFTINTTGNYAITHTNSFAGGAANVDITLNASGSDLLGPGYLISPTKQLAGATTSSANAAACASWTGRLTAGSVIRAQTNSGQSAGSAPALFTIARVS